MSAGIVIPTPSESLSVSLAPGGVLFVLGANGTGKSSLMFHLANSSTRTYWASGHRQLWLESSAADLRQEEHEHIRSLSEHPGNEPALRWSEPGRYGIQRTKSILHALHTAQRVRDRQVVELLDSGARDDGLACQRKSQDPLEKITQFFKVARLPIALSLDETDGWFVATRGDATYPINELSDGERSALLLGAAVVSEPEDTLFLIDEPERHLHRSIICPLLQAVFTARPDCRFVVATHELMLPLSFPDAEVLILRRCIFEESIPARWEADLTKAASALSDELKTNIWGGRRQLLFVEGTETSLDAKLYRLLFPDVSVYPKSGRPQVVAAVEAVTAAEEFTWVKVRGLVDGDRTPSADKDDLRGRSVHSLESRAVESLYYHPQVQREVAGPRCQREGGNLEDWLDAATQRTICTHDRLDADLRISRPPGSSDREFAQVIITQVAIKKTDIPQQIAEALMFRNQREYENAVLDRVVGNEAFAQKIIDLDTGLTDLASDLQVPLPG